MAHRHASIDEMGDGVFRKVRCEIGVTAFGADALVLPPGTEWFHHFHEEQDERVMLAMGGKGGYLERDGQIVDPADVERRKAVSAGDLSAIRRR